MLQASCILWLLSLVFLFFGGSVFPFQNHTFFRGSSRVVPAMSSSHVERSRSPVREGLPEDSSTKAPEDKVGNEGDKATAPGEDQQVAAASEFKQPEAFDQAQIAIPAAAPEENAGRVLPNAVVTASKSLEESVKQLESKVSLLETMRSDSPN